MQDYELLALDTVDNGCILPVKAKPAARSNQLNGVFNGSLKVSVTTAPEKGKANKAIIKLLAKSLGLAPKVIVLMSGETAGEKKFLIQEISAAELRQRFAEL